MSTPPRPPIPGHDLPASHAFPVMERAKRDQPGTGWRPWYDSIIDLLLGEPGITNREIAKRLGKGVGYLNLIMGSDSFRVRLSARRAEVNARIADGIAAGLGKVATVGLGIIAEKLERQRTNLPLEDITDATYGALEKLGYGAKNSAPQVAVTVNTAVVGASPSALAEARELLRSRQGAQPAVITGASGASVPVVEVLDAEVEEEPEADDLPA